MKTDIRNGIIKIMSKIERFLKNVIDELKCSSCWDEFWNAKKDGDCAIITLRSGTRFKISVEELEPTTAHDYDDQEMGREEFIEKYGDD